MKLKEIKNDNFHYFEDEKGLTQGEYKRYHHNGQLCSHCFFKDGMLHGKFEEYDLYGTLKYFHYYKNHVDVTDQVKRKLEKLELIEQL